MLESPAVYKVCTDCTVTPSRWLAATLLTLARSYHQYLPMKLRTQVWHHNVGYFKRVMRPYLTLFETQRAGPSIDVSFATRRHSPAARYDGNLARTCGDLIPPHNPPLPCSTRRAKAKLLKKLVRDVADSELLYMALVDLVSAKYRIGALESPMLCCLRVDLVACHRMVRVHSYLFPHVDTRGTSASLTWYPGVTHR